MSNVTGGDKIVNSRTGVFNLGLASVFFFFCNVCKVHGATATASECGKALH